MKQPWRPRIAPTGDLPDTTALVVLIAKYRNGLRAAGIGEELADRLTEQFQQQILSVAFEVATQDIETK